MQIPLGPILDFRIYKDEALKNEINPTMTRTLGDGVRYTSITCYLAFTGVRSISSIDGKPIVLTTTKGQEFKLPRYIDTQTHLIN